MFIIWFRGEYFSYIFYSSTHVFISGVYIWPNLCSAFSAMFSQFSKPLPMMLLVDFRFSLIPPPPLQRCLKLPWSFQSIPSTGCLHVPLQLNNDPPPSHPVDNSLLFNCLLALLSFGASRFTPSAPAALRAFSASRLQRFALHAFGFAFGLRRFVNSKRWIFVPSCILLSQPCPFKPHIPYSSNGFVNSIDALNWCPTPPGALTLPILNWYLIFLYNLMPWISEICMCFGFALFCLL